MAITLRQINSYLTPLLEDSAAAEEYLDSNANSQFARRTYVRSMFSTVEGTVWIFKTVLLKADSIGGKPRYTISQYALLMEESYEIKENGEARISAKFLKLSDNIRFVFKLINKLTQSEIDLGVGSKTWENFLQAVKIRNRIMHPKNTDSFTITDEEVELCKGVTSWFAHLTVDAFNAFSKRDKDGKLRGEPVLKVGKDSIRSTER